MKATHTSRKTAVKKFSASRWPSHPQPSAAVSALKAESLRNLLNCSANDGDRRFENWPAYAAAKR